jgi:anti-sigma regulatory factor (Ser/Thr protein kinase)
VVSLVEAVGKRGGVDAVVSSVVAATPEALAPLRHATVSAFLAAGGEAQQADDVALAVGEGCANAVRHAYPTLGEGQIKLDAWVEDGLFIVQIRDHGSLLDAETREAREGLGVELMRQVADTDVVPRASGGTEVRLAFPLHH